MNFCGYLGLQFLFVASTYATINTLLHTSILMQFLSSATLKLAVEIVTKYCIKNHVAVSENGPQTRILYRRTQKFSLFIHTFVGLALECYECAEASGMDLPGFNKKCDSNNIAKITCPDIYYYDRCITVKMKMSFAHMPPVTMEMRNCSSSVSCDPQSELNGKCADMPLDS